MGSMDTFWSSHRVFSPPLSGFPREYDEYIQSRHMRLLPFWFTGRLSV